MEVEHFIGEMSSELSDQELKKHLKKAGDFVIYTCASMDDRFIVNYFREVSVEKHELVEATTFGRFFVSKNDLVDHLQGDITRLVALIKSKIKIQIAWDFDKTLTREHTWPGYGHPPANKKHNQKYPE